MQDISKASSVMISRHAHKWKFVNNEKGEMERIIRLRWVLRGFMCLDAFDAWTFSGTARRPSHGLLASAAAREKQWAIASLDINMAFLEGLTDQGIAEPTGGKETAWRVLPCRLGQHRRFDLSLDLSTAMSRSAACSASSQAPAPRMHPESSH